MDEDIEILDRETHGGIEYNIVRYKKEYTGEFIEIEKGYLTISKSDKFKVFRTTSEAIAWLVGIFKHA